MWPMLLKNTYQWQFKCDFYDAYGKSLPDSCEADILINGGTNIIGYINKVRARAGAKALTGTATVRTVLDERT